MSNIDKITNTASSYIGGAKQTIGETIGNADLAAAGAHQKAHADTSLKIAEAKLQAENLGHSIESNIQKNAGSPAEDKSLEANGRASIALGSTGHNV
ncbi:hypothetical protein BC939DRAFT_461458 [Gamsiella multidivaricata]|uniref:uncharacterized protein n=1 Tax=Gamsiella multidivaricata TaxID=101098 RepID=UPI0022209619|nr:uncharacterized protein BC939DRAFT_461458 [Gamsiella multidivaricata]KAI7818925.1 hypothetical protein BC939DRAFT_461458 [Gamsiella multidivaricata]